MFKVILTRGLPGSGKSYLTEELKKYYEKSKFSVVVCSADSYFIGSDGVYRFDATKLGRAHQQCKDGFVQALLNTKNIVIVDNTNLTIGERKFYIDKAHEYRYNCEVVEPQTPWKLDIDELVKRNVHNVPLESLQRMLKKYYSDNESHSKTQ